MSKNIMRISSEMNEGWSQKEIVKLDDDLNQILINTTKDSKGNWWLTKATVISQSETIRANNYRAINLKTEI